MAKNRTAEKNKFATENYDRINYMVAKGKKDIIKSAATRRGISTNAYITMAVDALLALDGMQGTGRTDPVEDPTE